MKIGNEGKWVMSSLFLFFMINRSRRNAGSAAVTAKLQRRDILHHFWVHNWNLHHPFGMGVNFCPDAVKFEDFVPVYVY